MNKGGSDWEYLFPDTYQQGTVNNRGIGGEHQRTTIPSPPPRRSCTNVGAMQILFEPPPRLRRRLERAEEDTEISQQELCEDSIRSAKQVIELLASRDPILFGLRDHLPQIGINRKGHDLGDR